jgi:hypothetical protein
MMQNKIEMALGQEMPLRQQRALDLVKQHSVQVQLEQDEHIYNMSPKSLVCYLCSNQFSHLFSSK